MLYVAFSKKRRSLTFSFISGIGIRPRSAASRQISMIFFPLRMPVYDHRRRPNRIRIRIQHGKHRVQHASARYYGIEHGIDCLISNDPTDPIATRALVGVMLPLIRLHRLLHLRGFLIRLILCFFRLPICNLGRRRDLGWRGAPDRPFVPRQNPRCLVLIAARADGLLLRKGPVQKPYVI